MKLIVTFAVVVALVAVASAQNGHQNYPQILHSQFDQNEGGYKFEYETEDKIARSESGDVKTVNDKDNKPQQVVVVRGQYSYVDAEGVGHAVTYTADEKGFHAESNDIPKQA